MDNKINLKMVSKDVRQHTKQAIVCLLVEYVNIRGKLMIQHFCISQLALSGVFIITPFSASDMRGKIEKDYSKEVFYQNGLIFEPLETLYISSKKNVLRGLHFQKIKKQSKLIRCIQGTIWAVVVDLRKDSPTLGKWLSMELNSQNGKEIFVPGGCAFGSLAMEDTLMSCKCGEKFYAEYDSGIKWNDPDLNINWPIKDLAGDLVVSEKDKSLQSYQVYLEDIGRRL